MNPSQVSVPAHRGHRRWRAHRPRRRRRRSPPRRSAHHTEPLRHRLPDLRRPGHASTWKVGEQRARHRRARSPTVWSTVPAAFTGIAAERCGCHSQGQGRGLPHRAPRPTACDQEGQPKIELTVDGASGTRRTGSLTEPRTRGRRPSRHVRCAELRTPVAEPARRRPPTPTTSDPDARPRQRHVAVAEPARRPESPTPDRRPPATPPAGAGGHSVRDRPATELHSVTIENPADGKTVDS